MMKLCSPVGKAWDSELIVVGSIPVMAHDVIVKKKKTGHPNFLYFHVSRGNAGEPEY